MKYPIRHFCPILASGLLAACAVPQAETVEEPKKEPASEGAEVTNDLPTFGGPVNDGLRLPADITSMPGDEELRSIKPTGTAAKPSGIIVRPPGEETSSTEP